MHMPDLTSPNDDGQLFNVEYSQASTSPTAPLFAAVAEALRRAAPEREAQFDRETCGIVLRILDVDRWLCQTQFGAIQISTRTLEVTWAFCYASWVFYARVVMGKKPSGETVDLTKRRDVQPALRLLDWAMNAMGSEAGPFWPEDLPRPPVEVALASDEHVANELTLLALAFYLHHELAHTYLDAGATENMLAHERACDEAAAAWLLGVPDLPNEVRDKRALGVAVGLLLITANGLWTGRPDGVVHPFGFDRLVETLESHVMVDDETVWGVVVAILALHTTRARLSTPSGTYDTFHAAARAYRDPLKAAVAP